MNQEYYIDLIQKDLLKTIAASEKTELSKWKKANPHLYDAIYKAWDVSEDFGEEIKVDAEADFDKMFASIADQPDRTTKVVPLFSGKRLMAIAASVAILSIIGAFLFNQVATPSTIRLVAEVDNQLITLPDGSEIKMQKGANISYTDNFLGDRKVNLNGCAYFDVVHKEGATFTVVSPHYKVEVLGTRFFVDDANDQEKAEVQLVEGKVAVTQHSTKDKLTLNPRERVLIEQEGQSMEKINDLELGSFQWYSQTFSFNNSTFAEVVMEVELFFGIEVKVSSTINNCHFSGDIKGSEAGQILADLTAVFKGQLNKDGDAYIITGGKCQ